MLFKNAEMRRPFLLAIPEAVFGLIVGVVLLKISDSTSLVLWVMTPTLVLFICIFLVASWSFAKKIRAFTLQAKQSLQNKRDLQFDDFNEGDLAEMKNVFQSMALAHARQAQRLEEEKGLLQQSLVDITHQIKTPLSSLSLTAESLMGEDVSAAERKRAARKILDTTDHIDALVATLLKLSRLDAEAVTFRQNTFTVQALIDSACEPMEIAMEVRDVTLVKNVPAGIEITSDLLWLKEALMNIVKNCMEHTPAGGTVSVDVRDAATTTEIVVCDTGPGISEEDLPHLFERYYRGKDAGPNSVGIGLAFTDQVVRALGGAVEAQNRPAGGAMFTVRLKK